MKGGQENDKKDPWSGSDSGNNQQDSNGCFNVAALNGCSLEIVKQNPFTSCITFNAKALTLNGTPPFSCWIACGAKGVPEV